LAAFYLDIPVAHVEAGLRTYDRRQPFPEEVNRCLTAQVTDFHFAPTPRSQQNLLREGVAPDKVWVTGNTAIDALFYTLEKAGKKADEPSHGRRILLTAHRRENHGEGMEPICDAVLDLVKRYPDLEVVYPVHLSPRVRKTVFEKLANHPRVKLIDPLGYQEFVLAMSEATIILTDSGGVQEEAPSLGKPVLILREVTERPEASEAGVALAVGTDRHRIVREVARLFDDGDHYRKMSEAKNPYGDGTAAKQIVDLLIARLHA
jgi:UDP-N-acetylglucosamine 2-epimerase (non-hydrolysing)